MKNHCTICDCSVKNLFIPKYGSGNKLATIAWVSSYAPTKLENKLGTYQIPKYNALQLALNTWGFNESNSYFTHIIKCKMNRHPSPTEIINCSSNIVGELNTLPNLKIIVLIGNIAFKAFTNKSLAAWLYTPMLQRYVLIGIPHPEFAIRTNILYDFSIIYQMYNLTPHL